MTGNLPKPLQNDFDIIVIDLLSRYSLDNKSVQRFVQTVAQQVRNIRGLPRTLQPAKTSTGQGVKEDAKDKNNKDNDKPNFLTRLENLQNTFNKGGLLGVFFEYLKNRKADAQAKVTTPELPQTEQKNQTYQDQTIPESITGKQNNINEPVPIEQRIKPVDQPIETTNTKEADEQTPSQESSELKGLIGVVKNIHSILTKQSTTTNTPKPIEAVKDTPLPPVTTQTNNLDTQTNNLTTPVINTLENTNFSTVNANNTQTLDNETISTTSNTNNIDSDGIQAQQQDLLTDEAVVILGGINNSGQDDLTNILKSVLEGIKPEKEKAVKKDETGTAGGGGGGLLGMMAGLSQMGGLLGRMMPMLAKFGSALGVAGAALAGNYVGGQVGKMIGSDEKFSEYWYGSASAGKDAYEKYGTGIEGFTAASYDLLFGEGKELRETAKENTEREEKLKTQALERSKQTLEGTKVAESAEINQKVTEGLKQQLQTAQEEEKKFREEYEKSYDTWEGWNPFRTSEEDEAERNAKMAMESRQRTIIELQNKIAEIEKVNPDRDISKSAPEVKLKDGGIVTKPTVALVGEEEPEYVIPASKLDLFTTNNQQSTSFLNTTNSHSNVIPLAPETTKVTSPIPSSVTENNITNSIDQKTLTSIAENTKQTNKTLTTLGDAILRLASTINTGQPGSNIIINGANGQTQEYTSTSQIADNNVDAIRAIRRQFLAAIG